jgi:hypothetical protein
MSIVLKCVIGSLIVNDVNKVVNDVNKVWGEGGWVFGSKSDSKAFRAEGKNPGKAMFFHNISLEASPPPPLILQPTARMPVVQIPK